MKTRISKILKIWYTCLLFVFFVFGCSVSKKEKAETIRFGVCSDVHREILHDVDLRLRTFVRAMNEEEVDFIIQLGDFCQPQVFNEPFLDIWNSFNGPVYHVLGNHDMDNHMGDRFTQEYAAEFFGIPNRYYSFEKQGFHFIVLDDNDTKDPSNVGPATYIGSEQMEWLKDELESNDLPAVIFSHRSIIRSISNGDKVRKIFEHNNLVRKNKKVIACFNGHHHIDDVTEKNGIYYIDVYSMSYHFMGRDFSFPERYGRRMDLRYYRIKDTAPYKDPLYAIVTLNRDGSIIIEGTKSKWVGPSPQELGRFRSYHKYDKSTGESNVAPGISDRNLEPVD